MSSLNISKIQAEAKAFEDAKKEEIINALNDIRFTNNGVKVISESPKIFTLSASSLFLDKRFILSPEYHDFDAQFDAIIDGIRSRSLENAIKFLNKIIEEKRFVFKNSRGDFVFNDKVIDKLKETFE